MKKSEIKTTQVVEVKVWVIIHILNPFFKGFAFHQFISKWNLIQ